MEILGKLLGNTARVKIMKLFLLNKNKSFKIVDVSKRSRVNVQMVRKELKLLASVNFIKKRSTTSSEWIFNLSFKYTSEFEELLIRSDSLNNQVVLDNLKKIGRTKLIIVSGVFIKNNDSRVDLLIVGDKMNMSKIKDGIHKLEALVGTEIVYAIFDTKEFMYRLNMYDKLVRDIIDFPNEILLQSKELSTQALKKPQKLI